MKINDLTGKVFGRLTAIHQHKDGERHTKWVCECTCGVRKIVHTDTLQKGTTRSCGCLAIELLIKRALTHGHHRNRKSTKEYRAWCHAKARCQNPNDGKYPIYGGRGIQMSKEWAESYAVFFADMGPCPEGLTLDRIDTNGNYSSDNCRWATWSTQRRNQRRNPYYK